MRSIVYVGIDVHRKTYTLSSYTYVRMRDDHKLELKRIKQQILFFACVTDLFLPKGKVIGRYIAWLENLNLDAMLPEVLDEYLLTYHKFSKRLEIFYKRIEEISKSVISFQVELFFGG